MKLKSFKTEDLFVTRLLGVVSTWVLIWVSVFLYRECERNILQTYLFWFVLISLGSLFIINFYNIYKLIKDE